MFNRILKKKILPLILLAAMMASLCACGGKQEEPPAAESGRRYVDDVGREVELPEKIERIAVSGPMAQMLLFPLCPDRLVGVATAWDPRAEAYLEEAYYTLPVIGQLYGGKGELNLETLLSSGAQVVIDVGEPKSTAAEDLDALQKQTGIPFVHINVTTSTAGDSYRKLGDLLGMETEARRLGAYCDKVYGEMVELTASVEKVDALYLLGAEGSNVIARDSYHSEVMDLMTNNLAVVESPSSKGTGNEVDLEQILSWDPEVIIFANGSIYESVGEDPLWQNLTAIQEGRYYEVPFGPYNWMGFPPSVQRYLGMLWLGALLYPESVEYDLYEEVSAYYALFYHRELTQDQFDGLMANSIGKG